MTHSASRTTYPEPASDSRRSPHEDPVGPPRTGQDTPHLVVGEVGEDLRHGEVQLRSRRDGREQLGGELGDHDPVVADLVWRMRLLERERVTSSLDAIGCPVVPWHGRGTIDDVFRGLRQRAERSRGART